MSLCRTYGMPADTAGHPPDAAPGDRVGQRGSRSSISFHRSSATIHEPALTTHERQNHLTGHARPARLCKIALQAHGAGSAGIMACGI